MIDLVFSVLCAVGLGHVLRLSVHVHAGQLSIITLNYAVAVLGCAILIAHTTHTMATVAIGAGIAAGGLYVLGLLLEFGSIRVNGLGSTSTASQLGVAVPVVVAVLVWHEGMTPQRIVGLTLTAMALPLLTRTPAARSLPDAADHGTTSVVTGSAGAAAVGAPGDEGRVAAGQGAASSSTLGARAPAVEHRVSGIGHHVLGANDGDFPTRERLSPAAVGLLLGLFLVMGISQVTAKVQEEGAGPAGQTPYLLALFSTALVGSTVLRARRREQVTWREVELGIALGAVNLGSVVFLLRALAALPALIVFPVTSCGSLLLIVVTARWIWQERPTMSARAGIAVALLAVGLLVT